MRALLDISAWGILISIWCSRETTHRLRNRIYPDVGYLGNREPVRMRKKYNQALKALQAAHDACFKHPKRHVLGMTYGPFSGVNEALGIIDDLEQENMYLRQLLKEKQDMEKCREH
jgi:hypothetical protein